MVSVEEALQQIRSNSKKLNTLEVELVNALGYVVAEPIISSLSFPPFDQSAMDGYAVNYSNDRNEFSVLGEIKAGDSAANCILNEGEAFRIFTGAMLPANTTAVIKQEDVIREENRIKINCQLVAGEHMRLAGEQIKTGAVAIQEGTLLNPGAIGFLATIGINKVKVVRKPKISIIATGNELVELGLPLPIGKIYESNTHTLEAGLATYGFTANTQVVVDSYDLIKKTIQEAIESTDLVLITGGISVGDYDFVGAILEELEVEQKFYKVKQKPGKPLYFGKKGQTLIFALPGNPAAVLTSFYVYVLEVLALLTGRQNSFLETKFVQLESRIEKSPNLTFLLKGQLKGNRVCVLQAQSSAMLSSFVDSNCLIKLDAGKSVWDAGEEVEVILI